MKGDDSPGGPHYYLVDDLAPDCRKLGERAFREKYGDGFLLHQGQLEPARRPHQPQPTVVFGKPLSTVAPPSSSRPSPPSRKELLIFPVRNTGRSPYPSIITVGRTKNNDIVIADVAISKFHAFFKEESGAFYVQDAGSRNGTFLDDDHVPDKKHGKPIRVMPGAAIRFGAVEMKFAGAKDVFELVSKRIA